MKKSNNENFIITLFITLSFSFFLCQILISPKAKAETSQPRRIQSVLFDKGEPHKIFLNPGLASVVNFPCFVADSVLGSDTEALIRFSPTTKKSLYLSLKLNASVATNLLVRCEDQTTYFVLDLIPSMRVHQDVLEIRSSFGSPRMRDDEKKEITISKTKPLPKAKKVKTIVIKKPVLLQSSKRNR